MLLNHLRQSNERWGEGLQACNKQDICMKQQITDCINFVMHMVPPRIGHTAITWKLSMVAVT